MSDEENEQEITVINISQDECGGEFFEENSILEILCLDELQNIVEEAGSSCIDMFEENHLQVLLKHSLPHKPYSGFTFEERGDGCVLFCISVSDDSLLISEEKSGPFDSVDIYTRLSGVLKDKGFPIGSMFWVCIKTQTDQTIKNHTKTFSVTFDLTCSGYGGSLDLLAAKTRIDRAMPSLLSSNALAWASYQSPMTVSAGPVSVKFAEPKGGE